MYINTTMKTWKETLSFFIKNQTNNILIISNYQPT